MADNSRKASMQARAMNEEEEAPLEPEFQAWLLKAGVEARLPLAQMRVAYKGGWKAGWVEGFKARSKQVRTLPIAQR